MNTKNKNFKKYLINKSINNQKKYCTAKKIPMFIPLNGTCYSCNEDIFTHLQTAINSDKKLITRCPFCSKSFCD
jgi:hypothetical protein